MEKIYTDLERKITRLSVQEPNPYLDRKNKLAQEYVTQLDKVIKEYPPYKAEVENDYNQQLSILNGISKQLGILQNDIKENTRRLERNVDSGDLEIQKYKNVERNLQQFTSVENLDATSRQMLADHVSKYNRQKLLFWIKLGIIAFLLVDSIHDKNYDRVKLLVGMTLVFGLIHSIYVRYTSRG